MMMMMMIMMMKRIGKHIFIVICLVVFICMYVCMYVYVYTTSIDAYIHINMLTCILTRRPQLVLFDASMELFSMTRDHPTSNPLPPYPLIPII
jgi:uncharacterized transporter YbjL